MGKITPRIILFLLFSWFLTTTGFALPNNNYGPQPNSPKEQYKKQSYFIGFFINNLDPGVRGMLPKKNLLFRGKPRGIKSLAIAPRLNEAPSISAPADINLGNEPGKCFALKSKINLGTPTIEGTANNATNDAPS